MVHIQRLVCFVFVATYLAGLSAEVQAQTEVFNDYWIQPEVYNLPGAPNPATVDSKGDLHLQLPLLTVPGRGGLDYPITLSYTSGIRVRQEATWVGLGWQFDPGSVTRDPQGGAAWTGSEGIKSFNVDFTEAGEYLPDAYFVSIPGHGTVPITLRADASFMPGYPTNDVSGGVSTSWERFAPLEWRPWVVQAEPSSGPIQPGYSNGDVGKTGRIFASAGFDDDEDYERFAVTVEDGTRYVFAKPTLASFNGLIGYGVQPAPVTEYYVSAWRLVAILGADYNGPLEPDPAVDYSGSWVVLRYGEVTTYVRSGSCALGAPLIQKTYLREVVTPTHRALFNGGEESATNICIPMPTPGEPFPDEALTTIELYHRASGGDIFVRSVEFELNEGLFERYDDITPGLDTTRRGLEAIRFFDSARQEEPGYTFGYHTPNPDPDDFNGLDGDQTYDPEDDFGFFTQREVGAYESPGSLNLPGRDGGEYPESASWSLTSVEYPSGVEERYAYEHDVIAAGSHYVNNNFEPIKVSIPYAHVVGNLTNPFNATGGTYHFGCGITCGSNDDDYNYRGEFQGGIRVKSVRRTASHLSDQVSEYTYYRSMPSGIPQIYFRRLAEGNGTYFNSASRGSAAVYYEAIKRVDSPSETITTTYYTTPLYSESPVRYNRSVALRWSGTVTHPDYLTAISDNQSRLWGRHRKTLVEQPPEGEVPYSYSKSYRIERLSHRPERRTLPQVRFDWVRYDGQPRTRYEAIDVFWGYADDVVVRADTSYLYGGYMVGTKSFYLRDTHATSGAGVPSNFVRRTIEMRTNQHYPLVTQRTYAYDVEGYDNLRQAGVLAPVVREDIYEADVSVGLGRGVGSTPPRSQKTRFFLSDEDSLQVYQPASDSSDAARELGDVPTCGQDAICPDPVDPPDDEGGGSDPEPTVTPVRYLRSSVTTWQPAQGVGASSLSVWKPFRKYQWVADAPSDTRADFSAWGAPAASAPWALTEEYEAYDEHGRIVGLRNTAGSWVSLTYGGAASAHLIEVEVGGEGTEVGEEGTNALSQSFEYDDIGQLISRTDENGHTWRYRYDEGRRFYEAADPIGRVVESVSYNLQASSTSLRFVEAVTYPNGTLLANGSFEAYRAGTFNVTGGVREVDVWDGQGAELVTGVRPILGRRALELQAGEYVEQATETVDVGQELVLSFWVRGGGTQTSVRVTGTDITELGRSQELSASILPDGHSYSVSLQNDEWQRYWVHVHKGSLGPVSVRLTASSGASRWDAISLTPVLPGLSGDELQDALRPRAVVAFADEASNVVQIVDTDSWYTEAVERVSAVDVDFAGRAEKTWLPYEANTGSWAAQVYEEASGGEAASYYSSSGPGPEADGTPYVENEYYPGTSGRPLRTRPPGPTEGREFVEHWYRPRRFRVNPGEYLTLHEEETVDQDGRRTISYSNLDGEPVLTHAFADIPGDEVEVPDNLSLGHVLETESGGEIVEQEFTAEVNQYVSYDITLSVNSAKKAFVRFTVYEVGDDEEILVYEGESNVYYGSLAGGGERRIRSGFTVFAGLDYRVRVQLSVHKIGWNDEGEDPYTTPMASIEGMVRFKNDDGTVPMLVRTRFVRDPMGQVTAVRSPNAFAPPDGTSAEDWVSTYGYDTAGRLLRETTPDAGTVRYAYDRGGRLRFSQDEAQAEIRQPSEDWPKREEVTFNRYDKLGRLIISGQAELGYTPSFDSLDPETEEVFEADTQFWITVNAYDATPNLGAFPWNVQEGISNTSRLKNQEGRLAARAYHSGPDWQRQWRLEFFGYDMHGNVKDRWVYMEGQAPTWERFHYWYDARGNVVRMRAGVGDNMLDHYYTYDQRGQLVDVRVATNGSRPELSDVAYVYDVRGALTELKMSQQTGGSYAIVIPRTHDIRGRLTGIGDPSGWNWDPNQDAIGEAEPLLAKYRYSAGGKIQEIETLSPHAVRSCEATFGVTSACAPHWLYKLGYDSLGRIHAAWYHIYENGQEEVRSAFNVYHGHGASSSNKIKYDTNSNLLAITRRGPTLEYPEGTSVDHLTYSYVAGTNRLDWVFDAMGPSPDRGWDAEESDFYYDKNGTLTGRWQRRPDGTMRSAWRAWNDPTGMPVAGHIREDGLQIGYRYQYDASGQRVLRRYAPLEGDNLDPTLAPGGEYSVERYIRDSDRLVGVFDGEGVLQHWNLLGAGIEGRIYPVEVAFQVLAIEAETEAETEIEANVEEYIFEGLFAVGIEKGLALDVATKAHADVKGLLLAEVSPAVAKADDGTGTLDVDAAGSEFYSRSVRVVAGSIEQALTSTGMDPSNSSKYADAAASEVAQRGSAVVAKAVEGQRISSEDQVYVRRYYVKDHLGSVRAVVMPTGSVKEARDYYPFGLQMPGRVYVSGSETREGFTGHELDGETGMYYAGARYYMPALGRWTSIDPVAEFYPSLSPYNYAFNDPISWNDPTGKDPCDTDGDGSVDAECLPEIEVTADRSEDLNATRRVGAFERFFIGIGYNPYTNSAHARPEAEIVEAGGEFWVTPNYERMEQPDPSLMMPGVSAIGFAPGAARTALVGLRNGGGHAIRHLQGKVIPATGSLAARLKAFTKIATPILENPQHSFNWRIGATQTKGFLGTVNGQKVAVFVAKEGPYEGKVVGAIIPDPNQLSIMLSR